MHSNILSLELLPYTLAGSISRDQCDKGLWGQHNSELHWPHVYSDPLCVSNQRRLSAVEMPKDMKMTTEKKEFICQWTPCLIYSCSGQLDKS